VSPVKRLCSEVYVEMQNAHLDVPQRINLHTVLLGCPVRLELRAVDPGEALRSADESV